MAQQKRKKDRTPKHIAKIRKQRDRHYAMVGLAWTIVWVILFIIGISVHGVIGDVLTGMSYAVLAFTNYMGLVGHEKALRKIAGRPQADYNRIRTLERKYLPPPVKAKNTDAA